MTQEISSPTLPRICCMTSSHIISLNLAYDNTTWTNMRHASREIQGPTTSVLAEHVYKFLIVPISSLITSFIILHFHLIKLSKIPIWNYFLDIERLLSQ